MSDNEKPTKKNLRWRRLTTAWVWSWLKERRSSDKVAKTVLQKIASNPAVIGLAASATVVGAASGMGLISSGGEISTLEKRVVILEHKVKETEQIKNLLERLEGEISLALQKTEINEADIRALRVSLESIKAELEALPKRMNDLESKLNQLIKDLKSHEHPVPLTTTTTVPKVTTTTEPVIPVTTTTQSPTTTTTILPTTTTTFPPSTTTTTRKETKKECLTRTTRGEERTCSPLWVWLQLRLAAWRD